MGTWTHSSHYHNITLVGIAKFKESLQPRAEARVIQLVHFIFFSMMSFSELFAFVLLILYGIWYF